MNSEQGLEFTPGIDVNSGPLAQKAARWPSVLILLPKHNIPEYQFLETKQSPWHFPGALHVSSRFNSLVSTVTFVLLPYSIKFEFGLDVYASGGFKNLIFNAAIDLTIFGKRLYLAIGFNLNDPVGSIRFGADKSTEWYKDKMNKKGATSTAENYYDNPNPFADFEMSGTLLSSKAMDVIQYYILIPQEVILFSKGLEEKRMEILRRFSNEKKRVWKTTLDFQL